MIHKTTTTKLIIPLLLISLLLTIGALPIHGAKTVTETVSLLQINHHVQGNGYYWDNIDESLTLSGLDLRTPMPYGLKVPDNATVIIKGKNYIKAAEYALYFAGSVTIKGSGTLTIESDKYGIVSLSTKPTDSVNITECTLSVKAKEEPIHIEKASLLLSGAEVNLSSGSGICASVNSLTTGNCLKLTSDGQIMGKGNFSLAMSDLTIKSDTAALLTSGTISLDKMKIRAGQNSESISPVDTYSGEPCLTTYAEKTGRKSIFFRNSQVPYQIDYLIFLLCAALLVFLSILPTLLHRRKLKKHTKQKSAESPA